MPNPTPVADLAGPDLDDAVARKVMGWEKGEGRKRFDWYDGDWLVRTVCSWSPSTEPDECEEVKAQLRGMVGVLSITMDWYQADKKWFVSIDFRGHGQFAFRRSAPTEYEAVCRAALAAVREVKGG